MASKSNDVKHLIYSNFNPGSNCDEDCSGRTSFDCFHDQLAFEDTLRDLNITVEENILAIADIGRWNGRRTGYKVLGSNITSIFSTDCEKVMWYSDGHNIKSILAHHDGRNYVEYRIIKDPTNINNLLKKLYNGEEVTRAMINHYTRSLAPYVHEVYGWNIRKRKATQK